MDLNTDETRYVAHLARDGDERSTACGEPWQGWQAPRNPRHPTLAPDDQPKQGQQIRQCQACARVAYDRGKAGRDLLRSNMEDRVRGRVRMVADDLRALAAKIEQRADRDRYRSRLSFDGARKATDLGKLARETIYDVTWAVANLRLGDLAEDAAQADALSVLEADEKS